MTITVGTRLGPYEVVSPIGAGGMGEVWRARDTRLGRDVAVKVLPESVAQDPEALARFEREARAVAALNHPHILALFDFGRQDSTAYAVTELLEGDTLRERLRQAPLPLRKITDYGSQIAQGLAAAHERGIVHRDLKPENLFVTQDGRVKILDFGLARQTHAAGGADDTRSPTLTQQTEPGTVVGTAGYMSPEQVRGGAVDHRSDVFSFGCVLHEMATGRRAFQRPTAADTMAAILREEPEPLPRLRPDLPPALERIVLHCLEKSPGERFQSMRDVAFDLQALSAPELTGPSEALRPQRRLPFAWAGLGIAVLALAVISGFGLRALLDRREPPRFRKLTFQKGTIYSARFAPDGHTVLYGAAWRGEGIQLYSTRFDARESRPLGIAADVLAISPAGEMALSLGRAPVSSFMSAGRLGRAPLAGGGPREVLDGVVDADWSRDGTALAVTREVGGEARLEFPIGQVLVKAAGYLSSPRVSPGGDGVAFIQHPVKGDDRGLVALADRAGHVRNLTADLPSVTGLAWSPDGREIWFSPWIGDGGYSIEAVTPSGRRRTVDRLGARVKLYDVLGTRALVGYDDASCGMSGLLRGDAHERDLSWLDGSIAADLSHSGDLVLFSEGMEGGGPGYSFFVRKPGDPYPVRLGDGWGSEISPDGRWIVTYPPNPPYRLTVAPAGMGEPRTVELPGIESVIGASWFPDGKRLLLSASEPGQPLRSYVLDLSGGPRRAVTPPGVFTAWFTHALSPDGRFIAAADPDGKVNLYPVEGGEARPVPGMLPGEEPIRWTGDGHALYVRKRIELPNRVHRLDVTTGQREVWRELVPGDPAGVTEIPSVVPTPDGRFYIYSYLRMLTELYLIEGLE
jgi:WD40 repeat protein